MKILAFTDMHAGITAYKMVAAKAKKYKPDRIICLGDFTIFEQNIEGVLRKISELGKVLILHGNHETEAVLKRLCENYPNIEFAHKKIINSEGYIILGHGGGGFYGRGKLERDIDFENFVKKNKAKLTGKIILLTHAPPANTALDYVEWMKGHVGCLSYKEFIDKHKPVLALSGHLHENFKTKQKIGNTTLCNPGPEGMVLEL